MSSRQPPRGRRGRLTRRETDPALCRLPARRSVAELSGDLLLTEDQFRERVIALRDDFRRRSALVDGATVCDDIMNLFNKYVATKEQVVVTPVEAEKIGGYHSESLTRMVRQGQLPDLRARGSKGRIYIPLALVPYKPGHKRPDSAKVGQLATRVYGAVGRGRGRRAGRA